MMSGLWFVLSAAVSIAAIQTVPTERIFFSRDLPLVRHGPLGVAPHPEFREGHGRVWPAPPGRSLAPRFVSARP